MTEHVIRTDLEMAVVARDKSIHLLFSAKKDDGRGELEPAYTSNFLMPANDALVLSALLADLAFEAESGLKMPQAQKAELVQRHRSKLQERFRVVLNSTREKKTINNASLARQLVDIMSNEIFN